MTTKMHLYRGLPAASLVSLVLFGCERGGSPEAAPKPAEPTPVAPSAAGPVEAPAKAPAEGVEPAPSKLELSEWWEDRENFYLNAKELLRAGKKAEALEVLEDVLALDPSHRAAVIDKARILRELGRSEEEVIPDLEAALQAHPVDPSIIQELAVAHLAGGRPQKALALIDQAITREAAVPGARYIKAVILAEMKDREGALAALDDAVKNGYVNLPVLEAEDRFSFVSSDPRFQEALQVMRKFQDAVKAARKAGAEKAGR
jgi:tetratricopeptide (TPR) repeat protein